MCLCSAKPLKAAPCSNIHHRGWASHGECAQAWNSTPSQERWELSLDAGTHWFPSSQPCQPAYTLSSAACCQHPYCPGLPGMCLRNPRVMEQRNQARSGIGAAARSKPHCSSKKKRLVVYVLLVPAEGICNGLVQFLHLLTSLQSTKRALGAEEAKQTSYQDR